MNAVNPLSMDYIKIASKNTKIRLKIVSMVLFIFCCQKEFKIKDLEKVNFNDSKYCKK